jgi:hypothetical protein
VADTSVSRGKGMGGRSNMWRCGTTEGGGGGEGAGAMTMRDGAGHHDDRGGGGVEHQDQIRKCSTWHLIVLFFVDLFLDLLVEQ